MIVWEKQHRTGSDRGLTPYAHWWKTSDRPAHSQRRNAEGEPPDPEASDIQSFPLPGGFSAQSQPAVQGKDAPLAKDACFSLAVPKHAENAAYLPEDWLPGKIGPLIGADVPKDTVILGIVDEAISLGHARFRLTATAGRPDTRILAAWLQGAVYDKGPQPFGREMFTQEIETLMARHVSGDWLDEDAFNRAADPAPPGRIGRSDGARALAAHAAHGTHVLDLACGEDAFAADPEELKRRRIIAVSLPPRTTIGMAGTFLEFYVVFAMRRIVELADRLWRETHGGPGGFPIVLNVSYGQQAGTKTGTSLIETEFRKLSHGRLASAPLRLVMPIGNDNLTRSNARWSIRKNTTLPIPWRVLPEDQSSNFVEIWVDLTELEVRDGKTFPLEITLTAPNGETSEPICGTDGGFFDHPGGFLRVYTDVLEIAGMTEEAIGERKDADSSGGPAPQPLARRMRCVIAMRPTLDHARSGATGLAGRWSIGLKWRRDADFNAETDKDTKKNKEEGREVYVYVQVDQSPSETSRTSHRAYFDGERYQTHAPSGRILDSFAYLPCENDLANAGMDMAPANKFWSVQRKGTQNALATDKTILLIAGHRASDGRPADFSATVHPPERIPEAVSGMLHESPVASFPVDASATETGIRAAGAVSGSRAALRGTSCAAPQAARWAVAELRAALAREETDLSGTATAQALWKTAAENDERECSAGRFAARPIRAKLGGGRMPMPGKAP